MTHVQVVQSTGESDDAYVLATILKGAIVGGALTWFGVPWARSAVAGVASSFVARKARDSAEKS